MLRSTLLLSVLVTIAVASAKFILPTYRPPVTRHPPIYRVRRDVEPQWLYKGDVPKAPATGDHPYLPQYIDDVKLDPNTRYARSVDSPSAKRGGGSHSISSGSRDTGATHPGHNRRNSRSLHLPPTHPLHYPPLPPTFPKPSPFNPRPGAGKPILIARSKRDLQLPQKPKHHDIVLTGFNPNARVQPWQKIRVKA